MKLSRKDLRNLILEELNGTSAINEGCPTGLPCPVAAAKELKSAGASPEEMLDWVAKLTQELLSPVDTHGDDMDMGLPADNSADMSLTMALPEEL